VVVGLGVSARVLPAADEPVRTRVTARGRELPFQEFMILERGEGPIAALESADAIVIGPSNPIASIAPMLAIPGMREAIAAARAPVVAVSPFVGGEVLKGPTLEFCRWAGIEAGGAGLTQAYAGLLDGVVADERVEGLPCLVTDTLMDTPEARATVAATTLDFARSLSAA
jgi:LPPG:FO 2-phospho-L-lactate transferase